MEIPRCKVVITPQVGHKTIVFNNPTAPKSYLFKMVEEVEKQIGDSMRISADRIQDKNITGKEMELKQPDCI